MADPLLAIAGLALVCCGLAAAFWRRTRPASWLYLTASGVFTGRAVAGRVWHGLPAMLFTTGVVAWLLWYSRRRT